MPINVGDKITYPLHRQFHLALYLACDYLSMIELKLNHVEKRATADTVLTKLVDFNIVANIVLFGSISLNHDLRYATYFFFQI